MVIGGLFINNKLSEAQISMILELMHINPAMGFHFDITKKEYLNSQTLQLFPMSFDYKTIHEKQLNLNGHRGPDFINNVDLLTAGCSQTFGVGLNENETWPYFLSKNNNKTYNKMSYPGGSTYHIVNNLFKYFEFYGNPKSIFCVFPDVRRLRTIIDYEILNNESAFRPKEISGEVEKFNFVNANSARYYFNKSERKSDIPKYIKMPTSPEYIYSDLYCSSLNFNAIRSLEIYCNQHIIPFKWTTWSNSDFYFQNIYSSLFSNYIEVDSVAYDIDATHSLNCQEKIGHVNCNYHTNQIDIYGNKFYVADDNDHYGVHWQMHIAEMFSKYL